MNYLIEIATTDFATTKAAVEGGADRIELCAALSEGGITPSAGTLKKCRERFSLPLFPIIRPRSGDFLFSEEEYEIMLREVSLCKQLHCDGVVVGLLEKDGTVPQRKLSKLIDRAYPMEVTFHRAFDRCRNPLATLELLIEAGCQRLLTSGQQPTAPQGIALLAELVSAADNRIIVMPGSGVRKENICELAQKTGAVEFHASLRRKEKSRMDYIPPSFANDEESGLNPALDPTDVVALKNALRT